jgi:hypothetical protein
MRVIRSGVFLTFILFGLGVGNLYAKSDTPTLTGLIANQYGSAVSRASVALTDPLTNSSRVTASNNVGLFIFSNIRRDTYRLESKDDGFKKAVKTKGRAFVGATVELNIILEVGEVTASVDVLCRDIKSIIYNRR